MIDLHCHILPGIDDGSASWEESMEMARLSLADGVRTVIATPHFSAQLAPETVRSLAGEFNARLQAAGMPLTVAAGMEARLAPELPQLLDEGKIVAVAGKSVLVELPFYDLPIYTDQILFEVAKRGYGIILAHPERNTRVMEEPGLVYEWVSRGVMVQVNSGSLLGKFGSRVKQVTQKLIKANLVHFLGSDAHSPSVRRPDLGKASLELRRLSPHARDIYAVNGHLLLLDQFQPPEDYQLPGERKWWQRFMSF